jgi:class 3 adenylate cyclase/tetratricopeptide (TPR) repeat protein
LKLIQPNTGKITLPLSLRFDLHISHTLVILPEPCTRYNNPDLGYLLQKLKSFEGDKMKCPKCQSENPDRMKFCGECGAKMEKICPQCNFTNPPGFKFCGECGYDLRRPEQAPPRDDSEPIADGILTTSGMVEGERKYVSVLFSDMSGYTAMSERLDPEEVKEITSRIFGKISQIVSKYDGFIEKFVGDAVMALFGVPKAHEDDPVRAIKAAREIHDLVQAISPELEEKVGKPLSMHTGINTGLVVTGEVNLKKGTHGVAGDTINLAARLSSLAKANEIIVGQDTYHQAEGYFAFEGLEPTIVKGKTEPIQIYKALSPEEQPSTTHRHRGLRADLIGREVELAQLGEAAQKLQQGKGAIFSICGETGTGKTRLVEEFKATLDLKEIQWHQGQAYAYSQNTPYFPLIYLFSRAFQIKDGDAPESVRDKVESGVESLVGKREDIIPYVGSLYALSYPEVEGVSPEFWKSRLQEAVQAILSGLSQRAPTVIYLEDLHWADPSSMNLLRFLLSEFRYPALFLCVYRPSFSLFTSYQLSGLGMQHQEIQLHDLSPSEAQVMVESLLKTKTIPQELRRYIQENVEGNPFYLEEIINALIESETLSRDNGTWRLSRPISQSDMPSTIHGIISARLDHLEKESKRILQEASVIGRAFLYEILKRCTQLKEQLDRHLTGLERLDLIHARSLQPDLEYVFKSALTQEVVYDGLLKKERQVIHERIAEVIEGLFRDRLPEFYETLAFHFKQGHSTLKAVHYLMKSGEKSLGRYAVEESHQYFKEAFDLLSHKPERTREEDGLVIEVLIKWSLVFYYRGDFKEQVDLLSTHKELAESLDDKAKLGMYYAWLGFSLFFREKYTDSHQYLRKALGIGEEIGNQQVIGYACTWLAWTCPELGLLSEAISFGERAQEIFKHIPTDHYLFFKSLGGIGFACFYRGDRKRVLESGKAILDYGQRHSNIRSLVMGHYVIGLSFFMDGDFPSAIKVLRKGIQTAQDPFYSQFPRLMLGMSYARDSQFKEAREALQEVAFYGREFGCEEIGTPANMALGLTSIAEGQMGQGLKMIEETLRASRENLRRGWYANAEIALGQVYLQIVDKSAPVSLATMAKNIGFIMKNVPSAGKKAEDHFNEAAKIAKEIGAKGTLGEAYLDLGLLNKARGKTIQAREYITKAIQILEQCESEVFLKQAKEALASLE